MKHSCDEMGQVSSASHSGSQHHGFEPEGVEQESLLVPEGFRIGRQSPIRVGLVSRAPGQQVVNSVHHREVSRDRETGGLSGRGVHLLLPRLQAEPLGFGPEIDLASDTAVIGLDISSLKEDRGTVGGNGYLAITLAGAAADDDD